MVVMAARLVMKVAACEFSISILSSTLDTEETETEQLCFDPRSLSD